MRCRKTGSLDWYLRGTYSPRVDVARSESDPKATGPRTDGGARVPTRFDPFTASSAEDPYPLYRQLRDEDPVYRYESDTEQGWVLSRYDDVNSALIDWKTFSSVSGHSNRKSARLIGGDQLIETDPPLHDELRATVRDRFSPRNIGLLEPEINKASSKLLEGLQRRDVVDVAREYAWPLTVGIISDIVGIPGADRTAVLGWYLELEYSESEAIAAEAARHYGEYFGALASERLARPGDDVMSELMQLTQRGSLGRSDAVVLCMDLFEGGIDVPANLIANAVLALAGHPDQRPVLANPDVEATSLRLAIEELARYDAPIQNLPRTTTTDVMLHGVLIPRIVGQAAARVGESRRASLSRSGSVRHRAAASAECGLRERPPLLYRSPPRTTGDRDWAANAPQSFSRIPSGDPRGASPRQ